MGDHTQWTAQRTYARSARLEAIPERTIERATENAFEPRFLVLVHNDDVTPFDYVVQIIERIFLLSEELAEHVALTAHSDGIAVVIIRPREEALRLIAAAHSRARADGFPLSFSMQPEV